MIIPAAILLLPLLSAALIFFGLRRSGMMSALVATGSSLVCALFAALLYDVEDGVMEVMEWIKVGDFSAGLSLQVDDLSRGMMVVVTSIGACVHLFSLVYMKEDGAKARYFGSLSFFMFSMTGIVLASHLVMMFVFWELVGLSSYLLIGHWREKPAAAEAAKKAFLSNRVGDFLFLIGIMLLWGMTGTLVFEEIGEKLSNGVFPMGMLVGATLCLFGGALGKSAQAPLHVWLPDAMEGPTPVSALIHAATMVAAGVYMLVRTAFLMELAPVAATTIAWIGGITSLLAALMATQQDDIKKVLAYSTLSQLGYMVMAVGLGGAQEGMFHLFTNAFFKALLFLGSGAIIYACHHEQNIWKMGGLRKKMPVTFWTFVVGALALMGFPFVTSGFWSKEGILLVAWNESPLLFLVAWGVAILTAYYMTRLLWVVFFDEPRGEGAEHAKEVGGLMKVPLLFLAVLAVLAGFSVLAKPVLGEIYPDHHASFAEIWPVMLMSIAAVVIGAFWGLWKYFDHEGEDPVSVPLFRKLFYFNEAYAWLIKYFQDRVAWVLKGLDSIFIDGLLVGGVAGLARLFGGGVRKLQSGNLQSYALFFVLGVVLVIYLAVFFAS